MLEWLAQELEISTRLAAVIVALIAVQLTLQVYALVDLARRDAVRSAPRWLWAVIILGGNLIGAIVYLVIGRHPEKELAGPGASAEGGDVSRRAVDTLYGPRDRT
jgi:hypothetical protein